MESFLPGGCVVRPDRLPRVARPIQFLSGKDKDELEKLTQMAQDLALGPSTRSLVDEAARRDIPWIRLNDASLVQFGWGSKQRRIQAAETDRSGAIAARGPVRDAADGSNARGPRARSPSIQS